MQIPITINQSGKLALVTPVHNEAATIENTISEVREKIMVNFPQALFLIFEDGSRDGTEEILANIARQDPRIRVHTCRERKGYPSAVRDALANLDERKFDYVVFLDSDGQYEPGDFYKLWNEMNVSRADIVMGRRMNRVEPGYRIALSSGLKLVERILFRPNCTDITSAFRIMKTRVAKLLARKTVFSKYNFWLEFTARAAAEGYVVREVPILYRKREGSSKVYELAKMPKVVYDESRALIQVWSQYKNN